MGHSVTLGGERVGSGNKNKIYLRNYERSTHNLSYDWLSTMGCGMLIPFMCELATRDDKYEIDLDAGLRTIPTKGPLFGSFKLQLDVYQCPLRLYQALLHNNPLAIGLKANQVKFPKIRLWDSVDTETYKISQAANNSLVKYLGISGIGTIYNPEHDTTQIHRDLFGAGVLAYYDIFKNYYANKQEDKAYTLATSKTNTGLFQTWQYLFTEYWTRNDGDVKIQSAIGGNPNTALIQITTSNGTNFYDFHFQYNDPEGHTLKLTEEDILNEEIALTYFNSNSQRVNFSGRIKDLQDYFDSVDETRKTILTLMFDEKTQYMILRIRNLVPQDNESLLFHQLQLNYKTYIKEDSVILEPFDLKNIDDMRYNILSFHEFGSSYVLDGLDGDPVTGDPLPAPYFDAIGDNSDLLWKNPLQGICVKTYQSDIFNNWLNAELIDGENGIAEITAISTSSGQITIDQLQFSEKLYNLLNRIAVSGNTYQDYLDAAYTQSAKRFEESPIWIGGMSDEIVFEEIVQTAPADGSQLGTLGGRGNLLGRRKGGKITVKIDEPSLLIGIVSITPRIVQTQGNMWYNTEIDSLQDIHVPALDAIGFQNLMAEQLHFGTCIVGASGGEPERPIIGKVPAWINYMTNFDRAYGDFAATDGDGFMILNRNYDLSEEGELLDATTYIDPAKYNYAFAYTKREAQNFWVKIKCDIKARRLMSAKQIPTA